MNYYYNLLVYNMFIHESSRLTHADINLSRPPRERGHYDAIDMLGIGRIVLTIAAHAPSRNRPGGEQGGCNETPSAPTHGRPHEDKDAKGCRRGSSAKHLSEAVMSALRCAGSGGCARISLSISPSPIPG